LPATFIQTDFHELAGSLTHTRLQSGFARVTQAYETLTNPEARSLYDANIQAVRRVREAQEVNARADGAAKPRRQLGKKLRVAAQWPNWPRRDFRKEPWLCNKAKQMPLLPASRPLLASLQMNQGIVLILAARWRQPPNTPRGGK